MLRLSNLVCSDGSGNMSIKIRDMRNENALAFLEVHHAAVRGIAAKDYPQQVIDDCAPILITYESIRRVWWAPSGKWLEFGLALSPGSRKVSFQAARSIG
jgi:hypothetical protein